MAPKVYILEYRTGGAACHIAVPDVTRRQSDLSKIDDKPAVEHDDTVSSEKSAQICETNARTVAGPAGPAEKVIRIRGVQMLSSEYRQILDWLLAHLRETGEDTALIETALKRVE